MNRSFLHITAPIGLIILLAVGFFGMAGNLNPPAGSVAPTMKTLAEVEPRIAINAINTPGDADSLYRIAQRGSYYLTGNITGVVGKHGVEIAASGVTVDLNGFDLAGVAGSLDGVSVTVPSQTNIAVVNGSIRNWGSEGVDLFLQVSNCRVEGVLAQGNTGVGIIAGTGSTVSNCSARGNGVAGILSFPGSRISNCSAFENNNGQGIQASEGTTVTDCSAYFNQVGIQVDDGSTVVNCSAHDNVGGIFGGDGCTITNCSANFNDDVGIGVASGSTVAGCTARLNTLDGIMCTSSCLIRDNTCASNGNGVGNGAGIHATNADNRIEGNNCTNADRGIDVDGAGNLIVRNACSGNATNWDIAANNLFGPIIDRTTPASAAVNGNAALSTLGSAEANANFSY